LNRISPIADLFSQNTILFKQVFDDLLLALIHPTGNRDDEKRKWIQTRAHPGRLPRTKTPMSLKTEHNRVFVHYGVGSIYISYRLHQWLDESAPASSH
jgi:hypothetical protein